MVYELLFWFLPGILILGAITSYEDAKYGKIRNKWIVFSLIYVLITYLILFLFFKENISYDYLFKLSINGVLALFLGFGLWALGLWSAGDGKLFFAYSVLIPLTVYRGNYQNIFISLRLMVNTFFPIFLFYSLLIILRLNKLKGNKEIKKIFDVKRVVSLVISLFAFSWLFELFPMNLGFLSKLFLLLIILSLLERVLKLKGGLLMLVISVLRLIIDREIYSTEFLIGFILLFASFFILRLLLFDLAYYCYSKKIKIKELRQGMVLADNILKEGKTYKTERVSIYSLFSYLRNYRNKKEYLFEGINHLDEEKIKEIEKLNKLGLLKFDKIMVQETLPFAPFMFAGAIITLAIKTDIFNVLKEIITKFI
ncbi:MAG: hypothetical protein KAK00_09065 [Nanoarchaeota archaeon]|nr:hypothetical protein [Nanoarchaeota archaeon]